MDQGPSGSPSQRLNEPLNQWRKKFSQLRLPKVLPPPQLFVLFLWNRALAKVWCTFWHLHRPKVIRTPQFFYAFSLQRKFVECKCCSRYSLVHTLSSKSVPIPSFFICRPHLWNKCSEHAPFCNSYMKSSSGYSRVHVLMMSSSKSALGMPVFWRFEVLTELSLQSRAHFADLIFQKWSKRDSFWTFWSDEMQIELSQQSCALFVDNFCRSRPEPAKTETLLRRPRNPRSLLPKKTQGFTPLSPLNSHDSELLHPPTTWWWVVDMVSDVVDRSKCLPWQAFVTQKFSN